MSIIDENEPDTILITDQLWESIRSQFTEKEKVMLRAASVGEVICPKGIAIDRDKLNTRLSARITEEKRKYAATKTRNRR